MVGFGGGTLQRKGITKDGSPRWESAVAWGLREEHVWGDEVRRLFTALRETSFWGSREPQTALEQGSDTADLR